MYDCHEYDNEFDIKLIQAPLSLFYTQNNTQSLKVYSAKMRSISQLYKLN